MKPSAASKTPPIEPSNHWKEKIPFSMDRMVLERTPLQSAPWLQCEKDTRCLQFRMEDGAHPVLQRTRPLTSTADLQPVGPMAKVDRGPIRYTISQVSVNGIRLATINARTTG